MIDMLYEKLFEILKVNKKVFNVYPFSIPNKLTDIEKNILLDVYYEEDIARDIYKYFFKIYKKEIFKRSHFYESVHKEAVRIVLLNNNIDIKNEDKNDNLLIRIMLKEMGKIDLVNALKSALLLELNDIIEINSQIEYIHNIEAFSVLSFLLRGSYNHYNMFKRALFVNGLNICDTNFVDFINFIENKFLCHDYPYKTKTWKYYKHFDFIKNNKVLQENIYKMKIN